MREGKPSRTAQHNALFRAIEAKRPAAQRVCDDRLAGRFLPLELRAIAEAARIRPFRRAIERFIDARWPGPRYGLLVRTRLLDDAIAVAISDVDQVLILGAGFDTRAYRLHGMNVAPVFEVDHPSTQRVKEHTLCRAIGSVPSNVRLVPVEFGRDDLTVALTTAGLVTGARTLVLWEGVTNYLTADAVDATFRAIVSLVADGSPVFFTYVDRRLIDGSSAFVGASESSAHVRRVGEPYTFGFDPREVGAYLDERALRLVWDLPVSEVALRYYAEHDRPKGYAYYHVVEARRS
jgi:methyltransferase (TIGR00027 family)